MLCLRGDYMSDLYDQYVDVIFDGTRMQVAKGVHQYDHGMLLRIYGLPTDVLWQMHFGYRGSNASITSIATISGESIVGAIPDTLLMQQREIMCYLYYEDETYGKTVYEICIPVISRIEPKEGTYTPEEINTFNQLMAILQSLIDNFPEVATVPETESFFDIS